MENNFDSIVVGAGPAGIVSATHCSNNGFKVMLIEKAVVGGHLAQHKEITTFPGFKSISGVDLAVKMHEQANEAGVFTLYEEVKSIDVKSKVVVTESGSHRAKAIIIATGYVRKRLDLKNEQQFLDNGVYYSINADLSDCLDNLAVVVGGGNTALTTALHASPMFKGVVIVNNIDGFNNCPKMLLDKVEQTKNIEVVHKTGVAAIDFKRGLLFVNKKIKGVTLTNGKEILSNHVFVCIGHTASNDSYKGSKIKTVGDGYIDVDRCMKSSTDGVFACGDVVNKDVKSSISACGDGAVAAENACRYVSNCIKGADLNNKQNKRK